MNGDLSELYQNLILDHNRAPRNFRVMEGANRHADGYNPLCGDSLSVWLKLEGDKIADASFQGSGCAISKASASLMTDVLKGRSLSEVNALFDRFHRMVTTPPEEGVEDMGKLSVLAGVRAFPVRVKCASLAWHTLKAAMNNEHRISTE